MLSKEEIVNVLGEISLLNSKFKTLFDNVEKLPERPKPYQTEQGLKIWIKTLLDNANSTLERFSYLTENFLFTDLKIHKRFYVSFWSKIKRFGKQVSDFKVALQLLLYGHIEPERASRLARNARNSEVKLRFDRHFEFLCQIVLCEIFEPKNDYKISAEVLGDSFSFRLVRLIIEIF